MIEAPRNQEELWTSLFALRRFAGHGWTLIGGLMVHLHCLERGVAPTRSTTDADLVADVIADRFALRQLTFGLRSLGFTSEGGTLAGEEHRWERDGTSVDVLVPSGAERIRYLPSVSGAKAVSTGGGAQALKRSVPVEVSCGAASGTVPRPDLLGALVVKAAALRTKRERWQRHLFDFVTLAALATPADGIEKAGKRDRQHLRVAIADAHAYRSEYREVERGIPSIQALEQRLASVPPAVGREF
jgi:hypothetical protein